MRISGSAIFCARLHELSGLLDDCAIARTGRLQPPSSTLENRTDADADARQAGFPRATRAFTQGSAAIHRILTPRVHNTRGKCLKLHSGPVIRTLGDDLLLTRERYFDARVEASVVMQLHEAPLYPSLTQRWLLAGVQEAATLRCPRFPL